MRTIARKPPQPRRGKRRRWLGTLTAIPANDNLRLAVRRGCHLRLTDRKTGEIIGDEHEPRRLLVANIGDRLQLASVDADLYGEIAVVEIVRVDQDGWAETLVVRWFRGQLATATREVIVHDMHGLRSRSAVAAVKGRAA